jgi:membrane-associated phospholipid phosphatase
MLATATTGFEEPTGWACHINPFVVNRCRPKPMISWTTITGIGDLAIMAPAALAIMLWLVLAGENRLAFLWSALFALGMALVVATKMAFIGWGIGIRSLDFTGMSGHAMRVAAVIPVLFYLVLQKSSAAARMCAVLLGFAIAALIAISRMAVNAHSASEVVSGYLLGVVVSAGFILHASSLRHTVLTRNRMALTMIVLLVASCAGPAPTQHWLTEASLYLSGQEKPFMRTGWEFSRPRHVDHAL